MTEDQKAILALTKKVEELEAENKRLREALEYISTRPCEDTGKTPNEYKCWVECGACAAIEALDGVRGE